MSRFRAPKFGPFTEGRHSKPSQRPLEAAEDTGDAVEYSGAHRREGRHGITPATKPEHRPAATGQPAGRHRKAPAAPAPTGRHRAPEPAVWYPTKTDWRRMLAGETVNGHRLTRTAR